MPSRLIIRTHLQLNYQTSPHSSTLSSPIHSHCRPEYDSGGSTAVHLPSPILSLSLSLSIYLSLSLSPPSAASPPWVAALPPPASSPTNAHTYTRVSLLLSLPLSPLSLAPSPLLSQQLRGSAVSPPASSGRPPTAPNSTTNSSPNINLTTKSNSNSNQSIHQFKSQTQNPNLN